MWNFGIFTFSMMISMATTDNHILGIPDKRKLLKYLKRILK